MRNPLTLLLLGAGLAMMAAGGAAARPRDDVLANAFRCAPIGDARTWLDCYYGAAQPVRAALGLPPVPASQSALAANPPAGNPATADLLLRNQVMSQAVQCATQPDERQWLSCYYAAAGAARAQLGLDRGRSQAGPAPIQPLGQTAAAQNPMPAYGSGDPDFPLRMASYSFDSLGYFTVKLSNGQVWRQVNGDTSYAHWKEPAGHYQVSLSRGFLGSRNIAVKGEPGLFRVRQLN